MAPAGKRQPTNTARPDEQVWVARAHPNIALAKYWGKCSEELNLPAVPSLSVTLAGMSTTTRLRLDSSRRSDRLVLDGRRAGVRQTARVTELLDRVWAGRPRPPAEVVSDNDFPTASGLASSASAFAALVVAADAAAGTTRSASELSALARRASASAARSVFGGYVELPAGDPGQEELAARPLLGPEHWDLRLVVAVTTTGGKAVGSTEGMLHTARTSPLYAGWVAAAATICDEVRDALVRRDLEALGAAAEHSALTMHAAAMAAQPGLIFWKGSTLEVMAAVREMRRSAVPAYFTIDAGPHVKVITSPEAVDEVERRLAALPAVLRTIVARPGGPACLIEPNREGGLAP